MKGGCLAILLTVLIGTVAAACAPGVQGSGPGGHMNTEELDQMPYGLYRTARPAGSEPVPEGYEVAEGHFEAAVQAYEAERWLEAAEGFVAAADATPRGGPHGSTLAANRTAAYRNAVSAWKMARDTESARRALGPRLADDIECQPHVKLP